MKSKSILVYIIFSIYVSGCVFDPSQAGNPVSSSLYYVPNYYKYTKVNKESIYGVELSGLITDRYSLTYKVWNDEQNGTFTIESKFLDRIKLSVQNLNSEIDIVGFPTSYDPIEQKYIVVDLNGKEHKIKKNKINFTTFYFKETEPGLGNERQDNGTIVEIIDKSRYYYSVDVKDKYGRWTKKKLYMYKNCRFSNCIETREKQPNKLHVKDYNK